MSKDQAMSPVQLGCILDEIALTASTIERLALELSRCPDSDAAEVLPDAICSLAQRIGWAADLAAGGTGLRGGAEKWMMPPLYHHRTKTKKLQG